MKIPTDLLSIMTAAALTGCVANASVAPLVVPPVEQPEQTEVDVEVPETEPEPTETEAPEVEATPEPVEPIIHGDYCPPCGMG